MEFKNIGDAIVLNLTEERGAQVGDKAREASIELLTTAQVAVLGTDDIGCQSLLMAVRRQSASSARDIVAVSGGATLSDGWFALERNLYAVRGGRTRRIGSYLEGRAQERRRMQPRPSRPSERSRAVPGSGT